eukprot:scaffold133_cov257-Pinguiococcus_pyrenoidosus.AAC.21
MRRLAQPPRTSAPDTLRERRYPHQLRRAVFRSLPELRTPPRMRASRAMRALARRAPAPRLWYSCAAAAVAGRSSRSRASAERFEAVAPVAVASERLPAPVKPPQFVRRVLALVRKFWRMVYRLVRLGILTSPAVLTAPVAFMGPQAANELWWSYVVWAIEAAGPTIIKLAQWITTRPDLMSSNIVERLKSLQDDTKPHSFRHTERIMRKHFGRRWREQLRLDERSSILGSGSIAQVARYARSARSGLVYRGYHIQDQQEVAIKVLHPNVHEIIEEDTAILRTIVSFFEAVIPNLKYMSIGETVDEFGSLLQQQVREETRR